MTTKIQIKITSIRELITNGLSQEEIFKICDQVYDMVDFLCKDYPKHKSWFYKKHLPQTLNKNYNRDIIIAYDNEDNICGTALIKADELERKICTLYVVPEKQGLGIGSALVEKSMELLQTTKPMITFADYKLEMFKGLIKKYDWEQSQVVQGLYNDHSKELFYNSNIDTKKSGI